MESRHSIGQEKERDVFEKARKFTLARQVRQMGMLPYYRKLECNEGPVARIEGKTVLMLGSNNYLGLTMDQRVRQAAARAVTEFGPSLTGSRLLNGSMEMHEEFEKELAEFVGQEDALVFSTGYQANVGVLTALLGKNTVAVVDQYDHASIHDAVRTSGVERLRFGHNAIGELENILAAVPQDTAPLVVVDGVYSMEGDLAPIPLLLDACRRHGARLMVDDAHGIGVTGPGGRGTAAHYGLEKSVDLVVGTFSKSLASVGGFAAGPAEVIDLVRFFGRSILFSASLPPPSLAAAREALRILKQEPERVEQLGRNAARWREGLKASGFTIGGSETPIVPIVVGNDFLALRFWKELLDAGLYANAVLHPAVPRDRALMRTSVMATHTDLHLEQAFEIVTRVARKLGVVK